MLVRNRPHLTRLMLDAVRNSSSLAERMRQATNGANSSGDSVPGQTIHFDEQRDSKGEEFREIFLCPKRKLRTQISIDNEIGRSDVINYPKADIFNRMAVRRPRREEMSTDQDWPSVWPVPQSFKHSVVPLPVRMGTRRHPERRAPFKTEGNLELVKIPNFLHLTPEAIERHCNAIKKFCTKWPITLKKEVAEKFFPLEVIYSDYVHQGNSLRDMRSRVITVNVNISGLNFSEHAFDKFVRLAGNRYNHDTGILTIVADRCSTRKQNHDYAMYLIVALYNESNKTEVWEYKPEKADARKFCFKDSDIENDLIHLVTSLAKKIPAKDASGVSKEIKEFGASWENYRNQKETPETTREYATSIKQLLGIKPLI